MKKGGPCGRASYKVRLSKEMNSLAKRPWLRLTLILLLDLLALGACMITFALFHHVLPKAAEIRPITDPDRPAVFDHSGEDPDETEEERLARLTGEYLSVKRYESSPLPARTVSELPGYHGDGIDLFLRKVEYGLGEEKVTYYAADLFLDSVDLLHGSVAVKDGKVSTDYVYNQATACNALFAVSGDYFKNSEVGLAIRDGILYRNETTKNDVCLLKYDGSMEIIHGYNKAYLDDIGRRVWQAWSFGPSLLDDDGNVITDNNDFNVHSTGGTFHNTNMESENGVYAKNPRNLIGCVEAGHYVIILVDGRDPGYSCGVTFLDESQLAYDEGCTVAYNLDGGRSAMMVFEGALVDKPYKDGRPISDIIYLLNPVKEPVSGDTSSSGDASGASADK